MGARLEAERSARHARAPLFTFRGPGSAVGALLGAGTGYVASGRNGFYAGLALGAGVILGDIVDRLLIGRGLVSAAELAGIGRGVRSVLGLLMSVVAVLLLMSFVLTRQSIVLAGALIAGAAGAMLLELNTRATPPTGEPLRK